MQDETYESFLARLPKSVQAAIEAESIRAGREIPRERNYDLNAFHGHVLTPKREALVKKYIIRVFLAFSRAVCNLGLGAPFAFRDLESWCRTFLRLLATRAYREYLPPPRGLLVRRYLSDFEKTLAGFEETEEWQLHRAGFREVEDKYLAELDRRAAFDHPDDTDTDRARLSELYGGLSGLDEVDDPSVEPEMDPIDEEAPTENCSLEESDTGEETLAVTGPRADDADPSGSDPAKGEHEQSNAWELPLEPARPLSERGAGSVSEREPEAIGGPEGACERELGELAFSRGKLLVEYKLATHNPSNRGIYRARNSPIHKPQFYSWLRGELPASSATTVNFERFLREKRPPSRD